MTNKKTPTPLMFPLRSHDVWRDVWRDAYQYVLAACRAAGIEMPVTDQQVPILWKVRLKELPAEQFDRLLQSLIDQVELGISDDYREYMREGYDLSILTMDLDHYLRSTWARADRGSDLSDPESGALEVARWLAAREEYDAAVPKPESVLDIVTGGERVHEALVCYGEWEDWDPDFLAAMTRYRDACTFVESMNAKWRSLIAHRHETTPSPLSGSLFSDPKKPKKPKKP